MIEFTEEDRKMLRYAARSIEVQHPGFADSLGKLAERPAGDAEGLREWLRSDEAVALAERARELASPTCGVCGVEYVPDYEGICQEPGCRGYVEARGMRAVLAALADQTPSKPAEDAEGLEAAARAVVAADDACKRIESEGRDVGYESIEPGLEKVAFAASRRLLSAMDDLRAALADSTEGGERRG